MSLFDQDKVEALTEAIVNALRPVGVSVPEEAVNFALTGGEVQVMIVGLVRDSAGSKTSGQSQEDKAALNQMLADQHEMELANQIEEIRRMVAEGLETTLEQETCSHETVHEGLCLECGEEIDED